jgi:hypothetical protein
MTEDHFTEIVEESKQAPIDNRDEDTFERLDSVAARVVSKIGGGE